MKSRREPLPSLLDAARPLTQRVIARPGIRVREAVAYILAFALAVVTVVVFLRWHIASSYGEEMAHWGARQSSVADDRAHRVSDWLADRQAAAQLLAIRPSLRAALRAYYDAGQLPGRPAGSRRELAASLDEIEGFYPYSSVYVLDRDANVMARSSRSPPLSPVLTEICRKVAATGASRIDLVGKAPGETLIGFGVAVVPAPGTPGASPTPVRALGVALVVFDASHTLFPRVTREVVPARTGETLLVRHEGNDMVYFSPLRHVPPGSPNLRFPLSTAPTPASLALEGHETFVEYRDYRGVPVLAATHDFLFCRGEFANRSFDHPPRLVLLDLKLPKVDGLEVLRTVKGDPRTQAIPVVVLTSSREENDLVEGYKLGVNAYIQKPVEFDSFRQAVKQLGLFWLVVNEPPPPTAFRP